MYFNRTKDADEIQSSDIDSSIALAQKRGNVFVNQLGISNGSLALSNSVSNTTLSTPGDLSTEKDMSTTIPHTTEAIPDKTPMAENNNKKTTDRTNIELETTDKTVTVARTSYEAIETSDSTITFNPNAVESTENTPTTMESTRNATFTEDGASEDMTFPAETLGQTDDVSTIIVTKIKTITDTPTMDLTTTIGSGDLSTNDRTTVDIPNDVSTMKQGELQTGDVSNTIIQTTETKDNIKESSITTMKATTDSSTVDGHEVDTAGPISSTNQHSDESTINSDAMESTSDVATTLGPSTFKTIHGMSTVYQGPMDNEYASTISQTTTEILDDVSTVDPHTMGATDSISTKMNITGDMSTYDPLANETQPKEMTKSPNIVTSTDVMSDDTKTKTTQQRIIQTSDISTESEQTRGVSLSDIQSVSSQTVDFTTDVISSMSSQMIGTTGDMLTRNRQTSYAMSTTDQTSTSGSETTTNNQIKDESSTMNIDTTGEKTTMTQETTDGTLTTKIKATGYMSTISRQTTGGLSSLNHPTSGDMSTIDIQTMGDVSTTDSFASNVRTKTTLNPDLSSIQTTTTTLQSSTGLSGKFY